MSSVSGTSVSVRFCCGLLVLFKNIKSSAAPEMSIFVHTSIILHCCRKNLLTLIVLNEQRLKITRASQVVHEYC